MIQCTALATEVEKTARINVVPPLRLSFEPAKRSEFDDSEIPCAVPNPARPSARPNDMVVAI
jgi:hypothetical protein